MKYNNVLKYSLILLVLTLPFSVTAQQYRNLLAGKYGFSQVYRALQQNPD